MTSILDENLIAVLFMLIFVGIFLFCMGIVQIFRKRRKSRELVQKIKQGGFSEEVRPLRPETSFREPLPEKKKTPLLSFFSFFSRKSRKSKTAELSDPDDIQLKFLRAGIKSPNFGTAFFGAKLFLPILFVSIFLIVRFVFFPLLETNKTVLLLVLTGLFGFYLPDIWLKQKTDKRKIALFRALPDALDLLVVCVEAGMGLDSAIMKVSKEIEDTYPDLGREFAYLNLEIRAGKPRQEALKNLYRRTGIDEMNSLVTLLIQTDKFGTSVSKALKVFSQSFRTKRYQMAEEIAAKLPVKILLPLILFIFPALFVVILGPAAISIYQNLIMR